jgi:hypothetical protein
MGGAADEGNFSLGFSKLDRLHTVKFKSLLHRPDAGTKGVQKLICFCFRVAIPENDEKTIGNALPL